MIFKFSGFQSHLIFNILKLASPLFILKVLFQFGPITHSIMGLLAWVMQVWCRKHLTNYVIASHNSFTTSNQVCGEIWEALMPKVHRQCSDYTLSRKIKYNPVPITYGIKIRVLLGNIGYMHLHSLFQMLHGNAYRPSPIQKVSCVMSSVNIQGQIQLFGCVIELML